ncbi:MAG: dTDP-4-dehydrorhamnose reductase [Actinomycetota bacterium]|nr:dTDP-4-dehydrorhamnose reductase [Actinomycetota bacterium]
MAQKFLVTGAEGQLGREVVQALQKLRTAEVVGAGRAQLDVRQRDQVMGAVEGLSPDVIVHAGAWTAVDACEDDPDRAMATNAFGTRNLAEAARRHDAHLVYISTDYVFDGMAGRPYSEWDLPAPLSVYGRSKLGGEQEAGHAATVVRTSWVCGAHGTNFVSTMRRLARGDSEVKVVDDQWGSPTFASELASCVVRLGLDRRSGVWHATNQGETNWYQFARSVFRRSGADPDRVVPISTADLDPPRRAPRPVRSTLDNAALRAAGLPLALPWQEGLDAFVGSLGD